MTHTAPFLIVAVLLALFGMYEHTCLRCGGKGAHRDDCPLR